MKNNIMRCMSILGSIMLLGIACQKNNPVKETLKIEVEGGNAVTSPWDTTRLKLSYKVCESGSGKVVDSPFLSASSDESWVVVDSVTARVVYVKIVANYEPESRMGHLTLRHDGADPLVMTVTQKSNPEYRLDETLSMSFSVKEASAWRVICDVIPSTQNSYYHYDLLTRQKYESYADTKAFLDAQFFEMTQYRVTYMMTYGYDLPYTYFMRKGDQNMTVTGLDPETEYVAVAYAMTPAPTFAKKVYTKYIRTDAIPQPAPNFFISVDGAAVTVTPDNDARTYITFICEDSVWRKYSSPTAIAQDYIEDLGSDVAFYSRKGVTRVDYSSDLVKGKTYWVFAFGHLGNKINTGISYMSFQY